MQRSLLTSVFLRLNSVNSVFTVRLEGRSERVVVDIYYKSRMRHVARPGSYLCWFRQFLNLFAQASRNMWTWRSPFTLTDSTVLVPSLVGDTRLYSREYLCEFTEFYRSVQAVWKMNKNIGTVTKRCGLPKGNWHNKRRWNGRHLRYGGCKH
jgi:hypothetical protein